MKTTIVLADDHELVGRSICALLQDEPDFEVIGQCRNGRELLRMVEKLRPNVAVVDVAMPDMNGIEAALRLRDINRSTRTIMLTSYTDEGYLRGALEARVAAYVVKSGVAEDLIRAIRLGTSRSPYFSPTVAAIARRVQAGKPTGDSASTDGAHMLSPREREVLQLVVEGVPSGEIARRLCITRDTVKDHRKHIRQKLDIHTVAELTRYAIAIGMIREHPVVKAKA